MVDDDGLPPGGREVTDPPWAGWTPWQVAERLRGVEVPWAVAAGWAVDLFLGATGPDDAHREHEDVEISVPAAGFAQVRAALPELRFDVVGSGRVWPGDDAAALAAMHQTWGWDDDAQAYVLDVFREPHDGDVWVSRRHPDVRLPYADLVARTADGVPFVVPQVVLLFKARHARPKDEADLAVLLPRLDAAQRGWLAAALGTAHPGHPWIERVEAIGRTGR